MSLAMSIDDFLSLPGICDAEPDAKAQIRTWLTGIERAGHLGHLGDIVWAAKELWQRPLHDHFTQHGMGHFGRIVAKLTDWLAANKGCELNPMEAFLLIGAAYLHDSGMQCVNKEIQQKADIAFDPKNTAAPGYDALEMLRRRHSFMSKLMIEDACKEPAQRECPGFPLSARTFFHEAQLMALLALHHCGPLAEVPEPYRDGTKCHTVSPPVRPLLLIHLLRIGDALDADAQRLNHPFLESRVGGFAGLPAKDQFHTLKHAYTASVQRHGIGHFVFHYTFPKDTADLEAAVQFASEKALREHLRDAGKLLNAEGLALRCIESVIESRDDNCPYPLTDDARREFADYAAQAGQGAAALQRDPTAYLRWLLESASQIKIRGLVVKSGKAPLISLDELYIPLAMTDGRDGSREQFAAANAGKLRTAEQPMLEEALREARLVIVGEPGSGKSTFLDHIVTALCRAWIRHEEPIKENTLGLKDRPLPVHIRISDLAEHIERCRQRNEGPTSRNAPAWIAHFLESYGADGRNWKLDAAYFQKHFADGTALLLFDGLDEAASGAIRADISKLVDEAARSYGRCRFVVTSRPAAYTGEAVLPKFTHAYIQPLDDQAIEKFFHDWSRALHYDTPTQANRHAEELVAALHGKPEIRKLVRNPLMLTALAVVHWHEKKMPEGRAELYGSILGWLAKSRPAQPGSPTQEQTLVLLRTLALAMQDARDGRKDQVSRRWAAEQIASTWKKLDLSKELWVEASENWLEDVEINSGIVVKRGDKIKFWHLTFQEYLAARALGAASEKVQDKVLLACPPKLYAPEWQETVRLFAGVLHEQGTEKADGMITTILDSLGAKPTFAEEARCAGLLGGIVRDLTTSRLISADAAERILAAVKFKPDDARFAALMERVMEIFDAEKSKKVPIKDAIAAAEALGQAGDARFEAAERRKNWVHIQACEWTIAETQRTVQLPDYWIGKYPVTVLEFGDFIEAGGYTETEWWSDGTHGKWKEPEAWTDQQEHPTRPITGVSWFEARAYAAWCATTKWPGCHLVTDAEWERAAAGMEKRKYPWGTVKPNERLANYASKVGSLTPVGVYPCGSTPDGIADMAGNVWEWCEDRYDPKEAYRVLRGGSWIYDPDGLLSSFRFLYHPDYRGGLIGFRVVGACSP
jgi:hypothetical protein